MGNQTFQSLINPSEFIAKQVLCRPDSYSKQEPNVRTLWLKILFPDGHDEGAFIVPALDARSENLCSNLSLLEVDKHLPLFHLICLFLAFLLKCCNGSSLKPARPMCDGRPFASPLFRRLAGRGALFRITVHVATPHSREDPLSECSRPCDNLSCLCLTALWLQQSHSILVRENQPAKDIDLTCFKTFPIKATTCLQVGPCP